MSLSPEDNLPQPEEKEKKMSNRTILLIVLAVLVLAIVCCVIIVFVLVPMIIDVTVDNWLLQLLSGSPYLLLI